MSNIVEADYRVVRRDTAGDRIGDPLYRITGGKDGIRWRHSDRDKTERGKGKK